MFAKTIRKCDKMFSRTILHSDLNNFFASVETLYDPSLRNIPMAVGGSVESRHGVILAKNEIAKRYQVQTGEAIWQAKRKCPDLVIVPPHFDRYKKYSKLAQEIYYSYTNQVEPFGIDEAWLDVTGSKNLYGTGEDIAHAINQRMKNELGLTCSIGVSWNKIFAKLGSDYKKPDAITIITRENYRQIVAPQPIKNLLYVGKSTEERLQLYKIFTIGDLARANRDSLIKTLGKQGEILYSYARGEDISPVANFDDKTLPKSIGNSTTVPQDLTNFDEAKKVFYELAELVAHRLREENLKTVRLQITIKDNKFYSITRQMPLTNPTFLADDLAKNACKLFKKHYTFLNPVRLLGIAAIDLIPEDSAVQMDIFANTELIEKKENLAKIADKLNDKYGENSLKLAINYEASTTKNPPE